MPFPFDDDVPYSDLPDDDGGPLPGADGSVTGGLPTSMGGQPSYDFMDAMSVDDVFGEFDGADWGSDDETYHDANLAQFLDPGKRDVLAQNIIEWVDRDRQSRRGWEQREADGIRKLGLSPSDLDAVKSHVPGTEWRATATHPGLMKACIQFWARSYTELWPAGGPAKTVVLGRSTPEREQQAGRVKGFLNYLYTQEMPGATQEASQSLFRLPLSGSIFRKAFFDPVLGTLAVKFLESQDFVKPYSAVDLGSAVRYTHIVRMTRHELNQATGMGYYLHITKSDPTEESREHQSLDYAIDAATGVSPVQGDAQHDVEAENRDILYEMSVMLDLSDYGYDDPRQQDAIRDQDSGDLISVGLPYRVTVHLDEQRILAIRRDWRETDIKQRRRRDVVEYKFLPRRLWVRSAPYCGRAERCADRISPVSPRWMHA